MKKILIKIFACSLAIFGSVAAHAQESVQTNRSTELRAAPEDSAAIVQTLADKTSVVVQQRRGPWNQVKVGANTGWVRMMHLRGGSSVAIEQSSGSSGGFFASMNRLLLGDRERSTQTRQSATVGIRGFSKDDVARAELNPVELEKLKRFQVGDAQSRQYAKEGRLAFRSVAYLAQDAVEGAAGKGARK